MNYRTRVCFSRRIFRNKTVFVALIAIMMLFSTTVVSAGLTTTTYSMISTRESVTDYSVREYGDRSGTPYPCAVIRLIDPVSGIGYIGVSVTVDGSDSYMESGSTSLSASTKTPETYTIVPATYTLAVTNSLVASTGAISTTSSKIGAVSTTTISDPIKEPAATEPEVIPEPEPEPAATEPEPEFIPEPEVIPEPEPEFIPDPATPDPAALEKQVQQSNDPDSEKVNTRSSSGSGRIVSYDWTFGDGKYASGEIVTHEYLNKGVYSVELIVTDNNGNTDSTTMEITINEKEAINNPPVAYDDTIEIVSGSSYKCIDILSNDMDSDDDILKIDSITNPDKGEVKVQENYVYYRCPDNSGEDSFYYTIIDERGGTDTAMVNIDVIKPNSKLIAYAGEGYFGFEGDSLEFTGSATGGSPPYTYHWDFGDGTSGSGVTVQHTFDSPGYYTITLTVTDSDGGTGSDEVTVPVVEPDNPPTAGAGGPYSGYINDQIIFNGTNSTDDGTIESYEWDFGDGETSEGEIVKHSYTTPGEYTVLLTVTDDGGKTDTDSTNVEIVSGNRPPSQPEVEVIPEDDEYKYTFTAVSIDPDDDIIRYYFDWDDGTFTISPDFPSGTVLTSKHEWISDGIYLVKIYAEDIHNLTSEITEINITIGDPSSSNNTGNAGHGQTGSMGGGVLIENQAELLYKMIGVILAIIGIFGVMAYLYKKKGLNASGF